MKIFPFTMMAIILLTTTAEARDVKVRGSVRQDGTYVEPHYRSKPDNKADNNYSAKDNINPYTNKKGSQDPYAEKPSTRKRRE